MTKSRNIGRGGGAHSQPAPEIELRLPATSANLGPAFDAAALAFGLYLTVKAQRSDQFSVVATGRDAEICRDPDNHLILNTYRQVLEDLGRKAMPLALSIKNDIPIGKGCGSSAAARLAGIALAVHFGCLGWTDAQIVGEASRREHHPDNAAACWMGGVAVARMSGEAAAQIVQILPKGRWPLLLAVSAAGLSTEEARRVLPAHYSRADAVTNLQNSMLLLGALVQGRKELLATVLDDQIHQPYRAPLCPLLPALQSMAGTPGILGVALSGAGPSVLMFLDPDEPVAATKKRVEQVLRESGLVAELITTSIAKAGANQEPDWRKLAGTGR